MASLASFLCFANPNLSFAYKERDVTEFMQSNRNHFVFVYFRSSSSLLSASFVSHSCFFLFLGPTNFFNSDCLLCPFYSKTWPAFDSRFVFSPLFLTQYRFHYLIILATRLIFLISLHAHYRTEQKTQPKTKKMIVCL